MTSTNDKLNAILEILKLHDAMNRKNLKLLIMRTIHISDTHTVNSWIDKLVAYNFIEQRSGGLFPDLNYYVNHQLISSKLNRSITERQTENPKALSSVLNVSDRKESDRRTSLELIGEGSAKQPHSSDSEETVPSLQ